MQFLSFNNHNCNHPYRVLKNNILINFQFLTFCENKNPGQKDIDCHINLAETIINVWISHEKKLSSVEFL